MLYSPNGVNLSKYAFASSFSLSSTLLCTSLLSRITHSNGRGRILNPSVYSKVSYDRPGIGSISYAHSSFANAMYSEFAASPAPGQIRLPQPKDAPRPPKGVPFYIMDYMRMYNRWRRRLPAKLKKRTPNLRRTLIPYILTNSLIRFSR